MLVFITNYLFGVRTVVWYFFAANIYCM